jgi:hypothetical protein
MAISYPYYFSLSNLNTGIVSDIWLEPAGASSGNFLGNASSNSVYRSLNNNSSSWTMMWTQDHLKSPTNSGAVTIAADTNWAFGIDASNFPFVASTAEAYTFEEITLGEKNCLALSKNENAFTLTSFNIPAQQIESQQTKFFTPQSNLTGTGIHFGGGGFQPYLSKYFYGTIDQMALYNQVLTNDSLLTIFSGFLHQTIIYIPLPEINELQNISWQGTGGMTAGQINLISGAANYFVGDALLTPRTGNHYGNLILNNTTGYNSTNYLDETELYNAICPTDNVSPMGTTHFLGTQTGLPSFISADVYTNFRLDGNYFSFDFSETIPNLFLELDYKYVGGQSSFVAQNTGYYTGFVMNGVVMQNAEALALATFPSGFGKINKMGTFDVVQNYFKTPGALANDRVFLDGLPETGYSLSGDYIDISNIIETNENQLIYDQVSESGLYLQMFNLNDFATGKFYPKTAVVFTGTQSFSEIYRIPLGEFLETHPYHLYHGKPLPDDSMNPIYNNTDTNFF